jgi:HEAT repeat protein
MMTDTPSQLKAIDALVRIHTAMKNLQLSPPVHPAIIHFMEILYLHLVEILQQNAPLAFAELEKKVLLREIISNQQEDQTIPVSSLLHIFLCAGVKNISFHKDLEKEELRIFINLLAKKTRTAENKTAPVYPDHHVQAAPKKDQKVISNSDAFESTVSIALGKDQQIVSRLDLTEEQIFKSIAEMQVLFTRMNNMGGSIDSLPSEQQKDMIKTSSEKVAEWLEGETAFSPEFKIISQRLQTLLQDFIGYEYFSEANTIIAVFAKINAGTLRKDDDVREASLAVCRNLSSEKNIDLLFKEINAGEKDKTIEANKILTGLGDSALENILNRLRYSTDRKERLNILTIIEEMGQKALPAIKKKITSNAPWFFVRNMAYMLGRIGNDASADILQPLLLHNDKRVRKEAFKSILQAGGNKRGSLLLSVLPEADQELKGNIIEWLGKIKYTEAVSGLVDALKSKSAMDKDALISLQEKICTALGMIGSPEAIKALSEIAEAKSFLGIGSYSKEVKYAAEMALASIKRKRQA